MSAGQRKGLYWAGILGAAVAGFASHWVVPLAAKEVPQAQAAPQHEIEQRLQSIDLTLQDMRRDLSVQQTDVRVIKCYLHLENICPPSER